MYKIILVLITMFVTQGCASKYEIHKRNHDKMLQDSESSINTSKVCCNSLSEMSFDILNINKKVKKYIGPERDSYGYVKSGYDDELQFNKKEKSIEQLQGLSFEFSTGKSFFSAFELPPYQKGSFVKINSVIINGIGGGAALYPALIFLDKDFQIVRRVTEHKIEINTWHVWPTIEFETTLNQEERYMVVFTESDRFGQETPYTVNSSVTPLFVSGGMYFIPSPSMELTIPFSFEGIVYVKVKDK